MSRMMRLLRSPGSTRLAAASSQDLGCGLPAKHCMPLAGTTSSSSGRRSWREQAAFFSTSRSQSGRNRVFSPIRNADTLTTHILHSSSTRTPLLTLWTTSWCPTCKVVSPLLRRIVESGVGEAEGGVSLCEVEYDAPDMMSAGMGLTYMITSVPTLLSFDAGEAQTATRVVDGRQLSNREFLEEWVRTEARRHGGRGGGGGDVGGGGGRALFGGLFGSPK